MRLEIRGVEKLSHRERQVVTLKEMGESTDGIAKRLGMGAGSVTTLLGRARAKGYQVVIILEGDPLGIWGAGEEENDS